MDLTIFIVHHPVTCAECGAKLEPDSWISLAGPPPDTGGREPVEGKGALCLSCADLDHLIFLPAGDAALTRRARKHSTLSAVVLKWNRRRKRYERQGLLVESEALDQAEQECLADSDARARRRERDSIRREALDQKFVEQFSARIRQLFPNCPAGEEGIIAAHACEKYSGRVGRSAAAKELDEKVVRLAVIAHIRHTQTKYDTLLAAGTERRQARAMIEGDIDHVLMKWRGPQAA